MSLARAVLIVHTGRDDGRPRRVALEVRAALEGHGIQSAARPVEIAEELDLAAYAGIVLAVGVQDRRQRGAIADWLVRHRTQVSDGATGLIAVSLTAGRTVEADRRDTGRRVSELLRITGVSPKAVLHVNGAATREPEVENADASLANARGAQVSGFVDRFVQVLGADAVSTGRARLTVPDRPVPGARAATEAFTVGLGAAGPPSSVLAPAAMSLAASTPRQSVHDIDAKRPDQATDDHLQRTSRPRPLGADNAEPLAGVLFEVVFASAPTGIAIADLQGRILRANPALHMLLGTTTQEGIGTRLSDLTGPGQERPIREALGGRRTTFLTDTSYRTPAGALLRLTTTVSLIRLPADGQPICFIAQVQQRVGREEPVEDARPTTPAETQAGLAGADDFARAVEIRVREARRYRLQAVLLALRLESSDARAVGNTGAAAERTAAVARTMRHSIRDGDHCAEIDDGHFVVLLPHTALDEATIVGRRIAATLGHRDASRTIGVRLGVAAFDPSDTPKEWIARASAAADRASIGEVAIAGPPRPALTGSATDGDRP